MIGKHLFGWRDRRSRRIKIEPDLEFGGISIILVVDFDHLLSVTDKPLYHSISPGNKARTTVVKQTENQEFLPLIEKDLEIS